MAILSEERLASGSFDQKIIIWDTQNGKSISTLRGHTNWVGSLAVLSNTIYLAIGYAENFIHINHKNL